MRKRDENPIRKWNMISRLQFIELMLKMRKKNDILKKIFGCVSVKCYFFVWNFGNFSYDGILLYLILVFV